MDKPKEPGFIFDNDGIFKFIGIHRLPLLVVTIAAVLISTIACFLIDPLYRSTVIIFPSAATSVSNSLLGVNLPKKEILNFGKEEEVEQMLQVLQSDEIKNRIVDKYKLFEHYNINQSGRYPHTKLGEEYSERISFRRTPLMSIEIEVLDKDPQVAADIANDIAALVDTTINNMLKERAVKALKLVENTYKALIAHKKILDDSLRVIQSKGMYHYEYQSQALNEALGRALAEGKKAGAEEIEKKLKVLSDYGAAYVSLRDLLERETEKLSILETKYQEAKIDAEQTLPHKFVVTRAVKAEKKTYPVEWIIITLSAVTTFVFALFILIFLERIKKKN